MDNKIDKNTLMMEKDELPNDDNTIETLESIELSIQKASDHIEGQKADDIVVEALDNIVNDADNDFEENMFASISDQVVFDTGNLRETLEKEEILTNDIGEEDNVIHTTDSTKSIASAVKKIIGKIMSPIR